MLTRRQRKTIVVGDGAGASQDAAAEAKDVAEEDSLVADAASAVNAEYNTATDNTGKANQRKEKLARLRVLQCIKCGFCSNDEENLSHHLKSIHDINMAESDLHRNDSSPKPLHKCTECDYSSSNKHFLRQHFELVHVADRKFKCPFCNYAGKRSHSLKEHLVVHSSTPPFKCTLCNASFRKKGHLTNHVRMHARRNECKEEELKAAETMFTCDLCTFKVADIDSVEKHMLTHEHPPVYSCNDCSFSSAYSGSYGRHLQTSGHGCRPSQSGDTGNTSNTIVLMKCSECGFTTQDEQCLKSHMVQHIDKQQYELPDNRENAYRCSDCSFTCPTAQQFVNHIICHSISTSREKMPCTGNTDSGQCAGFTHDDKVGMYKCSLCGFMSEHQRSIKSHIWKHSGHKDIDYPMFQNGPLSVYDITPVGETVLFDDSQHKVKVISMEHKVREDSKDVQSASEEVTAESNVQELDSTIKNKQYILQCAWCTFIVNDVAGLQRHLEEAHNIRDKIQLPSELQLDLSRVVEVDQTEYNEAVLSAEEEYDERSEKPKDKVLVYRKDTSDGEEVLEIELSSQNNGISYVAMMADKTDDDVIETHSKKRKMADRNFANKRLCADEEDEDPVVHSSQSVVVQQVPQIYNVSYSSPRAPSPQLSRVSSRESLEEDNREEEPASQQDQGATAEEAVDLLSLLKRGPNFNPACPPKDSNAQQQLPNDAQVNQKRINRSDSEEFGVAGQRKKGICSSLLAVIEQLRERSRSESDGEGSLENSNQSGSSVKRRRHSRNSTEDQVLETLPNVEHITGEVLQVLYRCKFCHYMNISASMMRTHMKLHKAKQPSECSLCDYVADSSEELQDHMLRHCKVRVYQCKLCPSKFHYKSQLRAHMRAHDKGQPVACKYCNYEATDPGSLKQHMKTHMAWAACDICGHFDSDPDAQVTHVNSHSQTENRSPIFKCLRCDKYFVDKEELLSHRHEDTETTTTAEVPSRSLKCSACDFTTVDFEEMKEHAQSHQAVMLKCDMCDFKALSIRSLKSHMKRHANDQRFVQQPLEQYKCNLCGYVCHHLPSLKSHMWRHASHTNYSYQKTNDIINAAIDYDAIPPTPIGRAQVAVKPLQQEETPECLVTFRCCQCGFESINKAELHTHMKLHMDVIQKTMEIIPVNSPEGSRKKSDKESSRS